MPNWCSNNLTLTHKDPAMITRAKEALNRGEFLQEFIPCPQELKDTLAGSSGDPIEEAENKKKTAENLEKHGYANWYDFHVGEWGTKWDIDDQGGCDVTEDGLTLNTYFDSAWAPPTEAYMKLEDLGFGVNAMYFEPGIGFAGWYQDGHDDFYEVGSMTSDQVAEELPVELDETFAISEGMREWELENRDELQAWIEDGVDAKEEGNG
jgi:hypothetical protein